MQFFKRTDPVFLLFFLLLLGLLLFRGEHSDNNIAGSATDRTDNLILATGYVAPDVEAVYSFDQNSGRLSAGVLSRRSGTFQALFERNINQDLAEVLRKKESTFPSVPRYALVTGELDSERRGTSLWTVAKSVVYIAEINSGMLLVYTIPWQESLHGADQPSKDMLQFLTAEQFQPGNLPKAK